MKAFLLFFFFSFFLYAQHRAVLLDNFEDLSEWTIIKSDGAEIKFSSVDGKIGKCIRIDYNFKYGTGFCGIQKRLKIKLPETYRFSFYLRAESPNNNFEIKFLDDSRENVWWMNNRNFEFPNDWKKFFVRKRNIHFAWGPNQNKEFQEFSYIEFTIASFSGGQGTIFLDELIFEEILDTSLTQLKILPNKYNALIDGDNKTSITVTNKKTSFIVDFGKLFEIGGLKILWGNYLKKNLSIYESSDKINWNRILEVRDIFKKISYFQFKDLETKFLKFEITSNQKIKINDLKFYDYQFSDSKNNIFFDMAESGYKKFLPSYFSKKATYWTIVGMINDEKEALIDTDGMIEVDKNSFSILPFIEKDNKILTYTDFQKNQKLVYNYLPIPVVEWKSKDLKLIISSFSWGIPNKSTKLFVEYEVINLSRKKLSGKFHLAIVPFQVNPYYQFLNNPGGVSKIESINSSNNYFIIDGKKLAFNRKNVFTQVFDFNRNDVISALAEKNFVGQKSTSNTLKLNSGLLTYNFSIVSGDTFKLKLIYDYYNSMYSSLNEEEFERYINSEKDKCVNFWNEALNKTYLSGSPKVESLFNIVRSNLAYILINKDGAGIQPGSRSYERSWIRDGSLTSTALLRFGFNYDVREFIRWYASYIYDDGKVPCVVDYRGPDPVDEHDSHGEFLYLLYTYFEFTKDTSLLREIYPTVKKIVDYIDSMTSLRKNNKYQVDSLKVFFGLMPESISHEGYSAKPMHSFWDNFFTIRGLNDATKIAYLLGENNDYEKFLKLRDEFQINLINSINRTISIHKIDHIPGCVELGDFDPTSTSIVFFPSNFNKYLPQFELKNTFDKYYDFITQRKFNDEFINFTPYELRNINSFLLLNQKERALELLNFMLKYQRPAGWNHWAEVVWYDEQLPAFIGDMPHTWVGSDFINAFRNMFVYEDESDSTLKMLMGFDESFLDYKGSFEIKNLLTIGGPLNLRIRKINEHQINIEIDGELKLCSRKIHLINPLNKKIKSILINGIENNNFDEQKIQLLEVPAYLQINY